MNLETAQTLVAQTLSAARQRGFKPLAVVALDARGAIRALAAEDGTSTKRAEIALGKAHGAIAMGLGTRELAKRPPHFLAAVTHAVGGLLVPVPGGVLVRNSKGELLGAIGVSGETSDNDEAVAVAGIEAVGLSADPGA
ncbi:GlcG/HbpS family heme-binding protein [Microvirga sp. P5_D2]